jgi:hypothetical protein
MLQGLAALTPPLIVCVAFLIGVGVLVRRELAPRRQAGRAAARPDGPGAPGEGSAPREAETVPDRGDGSQT